MGHRLADNAAEHPWEEYRQLGFAAVLTKTKNGVIAIEGITKLLDKGAHHGIQSGEGTEIVILKENLEKVCLIATTSRSDLDILLGSKTELFDSILESACIVP